MSKILSAIIVAAIIAHLIRPFGLPGLTRRGDAWKIAAAAFVLILLISVVRPE